MSSEGSRVFLTPAEPGRTAYPIPLTVTVANPEEGVRAGQAGRCLPELDPGVTLIETMFARRETGARHLDRHLARLARSAQALGFALDRDETIAQVGQACNALAPGMASRLRLALAHDGRVAVTSASLPPLPDGRLAVLLDPTPLPANRPLAAHRTSSRAPHDNGVRRAELRGAFDSLFFTQDGRLVEGGRSNVFVNLSGRWWTPPLSDGALPGVMRGLLLEDPAWQAHERTLYLAELHHARSLIVCNALRGAVPARMVIDP